MTPPQSHANKIIAGINVTPLVDIMLVLLIVFMVTTTIVATPAVPLDLPRASQSEDVQVAFSVVLPAAGAMLVNGEPAMTDEVFLRQARDAFKRDPHVRAVISADGAVAHRRVIHALDLLRSAGIAKVAFAALPPDGVLP